MHGCLGSLYAACDCSFAVLPFVREARFPPAALWMCSGPVLSAFLQASRDSPPCTELSATACQDSTAAFTMWVFTSLIN